MKDEFDVEQLTCYEVFTKGELEHLALSMQLKGDIAKFDKYKYIKQRIASIITQHVLRYMEYEYVTDPETDDIKGCARMYFAKKKQIKK